MPASMFSFALHDIN
ncbi:hypothetical protein TNCV_1456001 [Trichonephila clavipes]|nr:hypothetical protein TNCV_1456001 [Trichonephila clavipes]